MIHKYDNNWAVWNIVEVLSFGDFTKLYELYYTKYPTQLSNRSIKLLWSLKFIRNAAAHNNCLLNTLRIPYTHTNLLQNNSITPTKELVTIVSKIETIKKNTRNKKLANPVIHDFVASLFLFDTVCKAQKLKDKTYNQLHKIF